MAGEDLTPLGHIAFLRKYAIELRALSRYSSPRVAGRLHQIAHELEAEADQLEKVVTGKG
jgi:hypothetical protein